MCVLKKSTYELLQHFEYMVQYLDISSHEKNRYIVCNKHFEYMVQHLDISYIT